jgi:hypothetical protein
LAVRREAAPCTPWPRNTRHQMHKRGTVAVPPRFSCGRSA